MLKIVPKLLIIYTNKIVSYLLIDVMIMMDFTVLLYASNEYDTKGLKLFEK